MLNRALKGWALPRRSSDPVRLEPRALHAGPQRVLRAAEPPEDTRLDDTNCTNEGCECNGASSAHVIDFARSGQNLRTVAPASPPADGGEGVLNCEKRGPLAKAADGTMR